MSHLKLATSQYTFKCTSFAHPPTTFYWADLSMLLHKVLYETSRMKIRPSLYTTLIPDVALPFLPFPVPRKCQNTTVGPRVFNGGDTIYACIGTDLHVLSSFLSINSDGYTLW